MRNWFNQIWILFLIVLFVSCEESPEYSIIPEIDFRNMSAYKAEDSLENLLLKVELKFGFIDGDGDLGHHTGAGSGSDTIRDIFVETYFRKVYNNGKLKGSIIDSLSMPYLDNNGKYLKGEITVDLDFIALRSDTVRFEFYVKDRSNNISNTVITPEYVIVFDSLQMYN